MPKKEAKQPKCANCSGPHVASYKGCPEYKKQAFRKHVVNHQKSYAVVVSHFETYYRILKLITVLII